MWIRCVAGTGRCWLAAAALVWVVAPAIEEANARLDTEEDDYSRGNV